MPPKIVGDNLTPLNLLRESHPDLYKEYVKKYVGREIVLENRIPKFNCLWNDVIHFTAMPPTLIDEGLKSVGLPGLVFNKEWFTIDASRLDKSKLIVWTYPEHHNTAPETFAEFKEKDMKKYAKMPEKTIEYYRKMKEIKRRPLLFAFAPHILYKGSIPIKDFEVIKLP